MSLHFPPPFRFSLSFIQFLLLYPCSQSLFLSIFSPFHLTFLPLPTLSQLFFPLLPSLLFNFSVLSFFSILLFPSSLASSWFPLNPLSLFFFPYFPSLSFLSWIPFFFLSSLPVPIPSLVCLILVLSFLVSYFFTLFHSLASTFLSLTLHQQLASPFFPPLSFSFFVSFHCVPFSPFNFPSFILRLPFPFTFSF